MCASDKLSSGQVCTAFADASPKPGYNSNCTVASRIDSCATGFVCQTKTGSSEPVCHVKAGGICNTTNAAVTKLCATNSTCQTTTGLVKKCKVNDASSCVGLLPCLDGSSCLAPAIQRAGEICTNCTVTDCKACTVSKSLCTECDGNKVPVNDGKACAQVISNCSEYNPNVLTQCTKCNGKGLTPSTNGISCETIGKCANGA